MIKTGDVIYCHNADDMIHTSKELTNSDIETDFLYEYKGENGYFLEITKGEYDEVDGKTMYSLANGETAVVEYDRYDTCKVSRECLEMLIKNYNEQFRRENTLAIREIESKNMENLKMLTQEQHKQLHRANLFAIQGRESVHMEEIKSKICDGYCKYPLQVPEGKTEDWLLEDDDSPCLTCPMSKL